MTGKSKKKKKKRGEGVDQAITPPPPPDDPPPQDDPPPPPPQDDPGPPPPQDDPPPPPPPDDPPPVPSREGRPPLSPGEDTGFSDDPVPPEHVEEECPTTSLKVNVVDNDDNKRFIPRALIEVEKAKLKVPSASGGPTIFSKLEVGSDKVKISFSEEDAKFFRIESDPGDTQDATLEEGKEAEVTFKVTPLLHVYLKLQFKDPDKDAEESERILPKGLEVQVVLDGDQKIECIVGDEGLLLDGPDGEKFIEIQRSKKWMTLEFKQKEKSFVVCEPWGKDVAVPELIQQADPYTEDSGLQKALEDKKRVFALPKEGLTLLNSDWSVTQAPTYVPKVAKFESLEILSTRVGDDQQPAVVTLDPNWQYLRFEYYDRFYGTSDHDEKPISSLPLLLEGYAEDVVSEENPPLDKLTTLSNWVVGPSDKPTERLQVLPWVIQADEDNKELGVPGQKSMLRFKTDEDHRFIKSKAADEREYVKLTDSDDDYKPGVERLRYYDLPEEWRSTEYFCRLSEKAEDQEFYEEMARKPTSQDKPLIFSLDDMVLTDKDLKPVDWNYNDPEQDDSPNDRVAVFRHTFEGDAWDAAEPVTAPTPPVVAPPAPPAPPPAPAPVDAGGRKPADDPEERRDDLADKPQGPSKNRWHSPQGLYRHDMANAAPYFSRIEVKANYLADHSKWTRLLAAQGNLFDVFDKRVEFDSSRAKKTVGARAAVAWVDATASGDGVAAGSNRPDPGLTKDAKHPYFSIHPYYRNEFFARNYPRPGTNSLDEWESPIAVGDNTADVGRFDLALLRSCDRDADTEKAVVIQLHRLTFDFASDPGSEVAGDDAAQKDWRSHFMSACASRWTGDDGVNGDRAWLIPKAGAPDFKAQVVTLLQSFESAVAMNQEARCHSKVKLVAEVGAGGSWMNAVEGTGQFRAQAGRDFPLARGFAGAHEIGHAHALPDEYPSNDSAYRQQGWGSNHVPGAPFNLDQPAGAQTMMVSNKKIRPRYFWHITEWLRNNFDDLKAEYKIVHGAENDYQLPHHQEGDTHPGRSFATWPIKAYTRYHTPATAIYDAYLMKTGKEIFTTQVLPDASGGSPIDGILTVLINLTLQFADYLDDPGKVARQRDIARKIYEGIDSRLNNKVFAAFNLDDPAVPGDPRKFEKCYLNFVVRFDSGFFNETHVRIKIDPTAAGWNRNFIGDKADFTVPFPDVEPVSWNAPIRDAAKAAIRSIMLCTGIDITANGANANDYRNIEAYKPVVQSLTGNAITPTITRL